MDGKASCGVRLHSSYLHPGGLFYQEGGHHFVVQWKAKNRNKADRNLVK